ncbi:MAG: hypothetical protein H0T65_20425 [Deltaproteobacteria bacterium]|nr:hypothetical protein [Deltaproteobacteria bacterium]
MAGDAIELVVHFAGTLVEVRRVSRHERYLIGTAPTVHLPLAIGTTLPLVDTGLVIRIPAGIEPVREGPRTTLQIGLVTIALTRVTDPPVYVPRPPASRRLVPFVLATLVLHVAVVTVAMLTAEVDPITIPVVRAEPPRHVAPKTLPAPRPRPKTQKPAARAKQASSQAAVAEQPAPAPTTVAEAREAARGAGFLGSASLDDLSALRGTKDLAAELADVGPIYDEEAANAKNFGGAGGSFDVSGPAFDSVKTGRYATVASGRGAGANYRLPARGKFREIGPPPIMGLTCDDGQCQTIGTLDRHTVRDYVEKRYVDMVKCYERHARNTPRVELTLHFEIGSDGKPNEVYADGAGAFGSCLVRLVERVKFPSDKPTQVRSYPVAFWRT